jgi:signal transduction histidine kinase
MAEPSDAGARQLVHDLRSPLMIIDGFAALLARDDGSLSAEQRADYALRIRAAADEMRALIDRTGKSAAG